MTNSDVYNFLKKKVAEGIQKDLEEAKQKEEDLKEIERTYKFLEEFKKEHDPEMQRYRFIPDHWLTMAYDSAWRHKEFLEMKGVWAEQEMQYQWLPYYREGKHTTGALSFNQIAEGTGCTVKEAKSFLYSLEKDGFIGKMKCNGFFPYWWYINDIQ